MFRYLAFAWNVADPQQTQTVERLSRRLAAPPGPWHEVLDTPGLRVFCAGARPTSLRAEVLPNQRGVILGSVFRRHRDLTDASPAPRAEPYPAEAEAIISTRGRWLIDECWGNYVALLADGSGGSTWILKDPTGTLPCLHTLIERVRVIFSSLRDCLQLAPPRFTVNIGYLRSRVAGTPEYLQESSLNEVEHVRRGQCVQLDTSADRAVQSTTTYWAPLDFSERSDAIEDPDFAARAMRATVRSCSHTLAGCHDSILLRLSGGLDSSIIAGCLADAPTRPTCYTYYNPDGRSDERPWARLAAQHGGYDHIEYPVIPADLHLQALLDLPPLVAPTPALGYLHRSTLEQELANERAATAVFNGDGGDSGFCSDSLAYAVPEYLRRKGIRPAALRLAAQVALRRQQSTWEVLRHGLRVWLLGARMNEHQQLQASISQLAAADLRDDVRAPARFPHHWFDHLTRVPWATIKRVGMLLHPPEFYDVALGQGRPPEVLSPLYSQPAIELLLRIALYCHFEGGRDRGLARRAFAPDVPEPILRRLWKDRGPGFHDELLHRNREFLRQLFLDGVLVRDGMLNRHAVEQAFSTTPSRQAVHSGEIFKQLELELWARQWS
jgi:asparagine synthase (glutamine-hydrolysing)